MDDTLALRPRDHTPLPAPLAYALELDGVSVGVAIPVRGGYVFRTAELALLPLDGRRFRRVGQVRHAADALRREPPAHVD